MANAKNLKATYPDAKKTKGKSPKKSAAVAARPPRKSGSRAASNVGATSKKLSRLSSKRTTTNSKIVPQPEWRITLVFGNSTGVYGLATDQRIYRWDTRSALWVLHKEGLSSTQQA
jgi:hypothetical protein